MANETTNKSDQETKQFVRGLLQADPGMELGPVHSALRRQKLPLLAQKEIDAIRKALGFEIQGRGRGRKVVDLRAKAKVPEATPGAQVGVAVDGAETSEMGAQTDVKERMLATQSRNNGEEVTESSDDRALTELVIKAQAIMERREILNIVIPQKGDAHLTYVRRRDLHLPSAVPVVHH
jgi:hypothetical protein